MIAHWTFSDCIVVPIHEESGKSFKAEQMLPPQLRVGFMLGHKMLGLLDGQLLTLVVVDSVQLQYLYFQKIMKKTRITDKQIKPHEPLMLIAQWLVWLMKCLVKYRILALKRPQCIPGSG